MSNLQTSQPNYAAWNIQESDYPRAGTLADQITFLLGYGILAPSTHNTQPWKFRLTNNGQLVIETDPKRLLPRADPRGSGLIFSLGACLFNLRVAAAHFGLTLTFSLTSEGAAPSLTLDFRPSDPSTAQPLGNLLSAIPQRQSHKVPFLPKALPADLLKTLGTAKEGTAHAVISADESVRQSLALLHRDATLTFQDKPGFTKEVSSWMRPTNTTSFDGMPGSAFGMSQPQSLVAKFMTGVSPKSVKVPAQKDFAVLSTCPAVGAVVTDRDTPQGWLDAGQLYQHLGLIAAQNGLGLAPKAAAIQAGRADKVAQVFNQAGHPQMYFALGFTDGVVRHTPRRPLDQVITRSNA